MIAPTFGGRPRPDLKPTAEAGFYEDARGGVHMADGPVVSARDELRALVNDGCDRSDRSDQSPPQTTFRRFGRFGRNSEWPVSLAPEARHGLAGDLVALIEPHSEADPVALLAQTLVAFGNVIGRGAGFMAEGDFHATNLNLAIVGQTSKARKGTSWGRIKQAFALVDPDWVEGCITSGLSSGEGVVWRVRDATLTRRKAKKGETADEDGYLDEITDAGVDDKRLLVVEGELAQALRVMRREGNTLSVTVRNLWDSGTQGSLTKTSPGRTTDALMSIIGHIVGDELRRELTATDAANGFANRFLFICARRSKALPDGGNIPESDLAAICRLIAAMVQHARSAGVLQRDNHARELWHSVYPRLSEGRAGLLGAITGRAEAQVMRLAVIYALLDGCREVRVEHLRAALALWDYSERSAAYIFGATLGDPVADEILAALLQAPDGLTRTAIRDLFKRHQAVERIDLALAALAEAKLAVRRDIKTGGRTAEAWFAVRDRSDQGAAA